jgi:Protein of unknown function (DUF3761)
MPHHDDLEDDPRDLRDWLYGKLMQGNQPGGGQLSGPDPGYALDPQPPHRWKRLRKYVILLAGAAAAVMAAMFLRDTTLDPGRHGEAQPRQLASVPRETVYAQRTVRVHSGAGDEFPVVRTLTRGERVVAGPRDSKRWTQLFDTGGQPIGYAYVSGGNLTHELPRDSTQAATAICGDGTLSYSKHRSGTCARHDSVATWINRPEN